DKFIDNNEIATYTGAFTSNYRPRQELSLLNNGQNPNGTWYLVVNDDTAISTAGTVTNVALTFGANPAKPLLSSSTLPIIKIYTANGDDIPDDPKILADMFIINNGAGAFNYANQTTYQVKSKIAIEIRGNSSAALPTIPKKQYGFETRDVAGANSVDLSLFGMPAGSDWILSAVMSDKSLMRNVLTYQMSREMGWWASRTQFCEVMINDEYRGVFIFEEKIKRNANRVPIEKLNVTDVTLPNLTGGYIFSTDDLDKGDVIWRSKITPLPDNPYKFVYPKPEDVQSAQKDYLVKYVDDFEAALHGDNFQDPVEGFRKYADDKSFIDFFLLNEISKNNDAFRFSTYFYKKRGGKIIAGPVWDFDRAWRNENACESYLPTGYIYQRTQGCDGRSLQWWWARLLEDTKYKQDLVCRYNALRQTTLSLQRLYRIIDSSAASLNAGAQQRNFTRWNIWGKYVVRIPKPYSTSYDVEVNTLKQWVADRLAWLDNDLGVCTPPVTNVITKSNTDEEALSGTAIYPSPFKDHLVVSLKIPADQQVQFDLTDINGKSIYRKQLLLKKGAQQVRLDVNSKQAASGLYLLQVNGTTFKMAKKVMKQ
ncbi:MAG TPA: CotH kinase family protein, partial [Niastella sp.]|nr:CotH kinase family protein [Niastella sp.]